jgi:hypothetical protein
MSSYAPSAPPEIWAAKDLDAGTKISVMAMWSWANHEDQQNIKTVTVYAKARGDMSPTESLIAQIAGQTGASPRAVREHMTKAKAAGYAVISGLAATLRWPPVPQARRDSVKTVRDSVTELRDSVDAIAAGSDAITSRTDAIAAGSDAITSNQLNPPPPQLNPPPPQGQRGLFGEGADPPRSEAPEKTKGATPALVREWWSTVYAPLRLSVFKRWRPDDDIVDEPPCTEKRVSLIRLRLEESAPGAEWAELKTMLTHVVRCAAARVDASGARKVPYKNSTYDTIRNIDASFWLKQANFTSLLEDSAPAEPRQGTSRSSHTNYRPGEYVDPIELEDLL